MNYLFLRVDTDAGISGYGEVSDGYGCSHPVSTGEVIREALLPIIKDENPEDVERLYLKMRGWTRRRLGDSGMIIQAISGVEIALWDIAGKARGMPISRLLGGNGRLRIPIYASGPFLEEADADWHALLFDPCLKQGVGAIKVRTGLRPEKDLETLANLKRVIGDQIKIGVDGSEHYSLSSAVKLARKFSDHGVMFFEEPLPQHNLEGMRKLVERSPIDVAYGEHCYTMHGFRQLISHKAADIFQPDAAIAGGILESKKICALADTFGIMAIPHCAAGPVALAANLHVCASVCNLALLEYPFTLDALWRELLVEPMFSPNTLDNGMLRVPLSPGLGVELNEKAFEKFPYKAQEPVREMPTWCLGYA